jgi:hypothetical protein
MRSRELEFLSDRDWFVRLNARSTSHLWVRSSTLSDTH